MQRTCFVVLLLVVYGYTISIDERVEQILPKMTLEEKIAQTLHVYLSPDEIINKYGATGVGAVYIFAASKLETLILTHR
jgi:hypothetical protein